MTRLEWLVTIAGMRDRRFLGAAAAALALWGCTTNTTTYLVEPEPDGAAGGVEASVDGSVREADAGVDVAVAEVDAGADAAPDAFVAVDAPPAPPACVSPVVTGDAASAASRECFPIHDDAGVYCGSSACGTYAYRCDMAPYTEIPELRGCVAPTAGACTTTCGIGLNGAVCCSDDRCSRVESNDQFCTGTLKFAYVCHTNAQANSAAGCLEQADQFGGPSPAMCCEKEL